MKPMIFLILFLMIPLVYAEEECGITNLGACLPEKFFQYIESIFQSPLQSMLDLITSFLSEPVNTELFKPIWNVITYLTSAFYSLLFLYSGFNFMFSGYDSLKRENAKSQLKDFFIMIVLVNASFFLYSILIDAGSTLTAGIINMIPKEFFKLAPDNIAEFGLQLFLALSYFLTAFMTLLLLIIRYIIVSVGVIMFPIGIFLYFIPFAKDFGKMILSFLSTSIFLTFFDALIIIACSKITAIALFSNLGIMLMISALTGCNILMFYFMLFSTIKSAFSATAKIQRLAR